MTKNTGIKIRQLRAIGHKLKPVVTISQAGLTDGVSLELDRALRDHELIKVKIPSKSSGSRSEIIDEICKASSAKIVQELGNILLIMRRTENPNPKLSNLIRII